MEKTTNCPVCGATDAKQYELVGGFPRPDGGHDLAATSECPVCGMYYATLAVLPELKEGEAHLLSSWIRSRNESNAPPDISHKNLKEIRAGFRPLKVREQMDLLLQAIERREEHYGHRQDIPLRLLRAIVWEKQNDASHWLLDAIEKRGWIVPGITGARQSGESRSVIITLEGHIRLEELVRAAALPSRIFVAMWFDPKLESLYEQGIRPAVEAAGYDAFRVDRAQDSGDRVDARIMVEIGRSRAMIADATGIRPSVLYEAGFAEGLGKQVIWTVKKDVLNGKKLPFDTRQFPHCAWTNAADLAEGLRWIIEKRLGPGPGRKDKQGERPGAV